MQPKSLNSSMNHTSKISQAPGVGTLLVMAVTLGMNAVAQIGPGYALNFDGVGAHVVVPSGESINPGTNSFTIEAWIKTSDAIDSQAIVSKYECGGECPPTANSLFEIFVGPGGFLGAAIRTSMDDVGQRIAGHTLVADGNWHHVAMERDQEAGLLALYVDGVQETNAVLSAASTGPIQNDDGEPDPLVIGAEASPASSAFQGFFKGEIGEVRLWWVARSISDVMANMHRPLSLPQAGLVAYWKFDEGSGFYAYDAAEGLSGILENQPTWVPSTIPFVPTALTLPASQIGSGSATLNGLVNPNGLPTTVWFQWGPTSNYVNVTVSTNIPPMTNVVSIALSFNGLTANEMFNCLVSRICG